MKRFNVKMIVAVMTILVFIASATSVRAQQNLLAGVTVSGWSNMSTPADSIEVTLRVASHAPITDAALAPIRDALIRAGVDAQTILNPPIPIDSIAPYRIIISGTVWKPTVQGLKRGIPLLADAFHANAQLSLEEASVLARLDNCSTLRHQAESNALADARAQSLYIAKAGGFTLGRLTAVSANVGGGGPNQVECISVSSIGATGMPLNPDLPRVLRVFVHGNVTVTYAIVNP